MNGCQASFRTTVIDLFWLNRRTEHSILVAAAVSSDILEQLVLIDLLNTGPLRLQIPAKIISVQSFATMLGSCATTGAETEGIKHHNGSGATCAPCEAARTMKIAIQLECWIALFLII